MIKLKVVLFKHVDKNFTQLQDMTYDDNLEDMYLSDPQNGYVQISEVMEMELKELDEPTVLSNSLNALDKENKKLDAEYQVRKDKLEATKQNLLSIGVDK